MLVAVMFGAALGAPSRWLLDRFVVKRYGGPFPLGTFVINVLGSFVLGLILGAGAAEPVVALLGTGFCGGFTTFSTFGFEAVRLAEQGDSRRAFGYVAASVVVGLMAALLGWSLGGLIPSAR